MLAFNAIVVGMVGGFLLALLWHLVALVGGFYVPEAVTTLLFLIGWVGLAIWILKA